MGANISSMKDVLNSTADDYTNFAEVRCYVGEPVARKLMFSFGGVRIYIPSPTDMGDDHPIVQALGRQDAQHLAAMFKGSPVDIPLGPNSRQFNQQNECLRRYESGESASEIALAMQVCERSVRRWFKKLGLSPKTNRRSRDLRTAMRRAPAIGGGADLHDEDGAAR